MSKSNTKLKATAVDADANTLTAYKSKRGRVYTVPLKYASAPSVSALIRAMFGDGYTKAAIAKTTGILYQHCKNVLDRPLKKVEAS